ncbi:nucleotidyl transferase AbiEii/AbiGii toxin family protein [Xenorhabdus bovienii]|uniref:nucleotidyl transferase AbiEii/AbiGii toxin family protein n=1 Tax=Xenorhabdus bovienii TaxID=40576 RepID=UPI0023B348AB|nr:nucleotidyl transferase AbiEii/AbiGii toxin family protein [Xenorhabdus bovienii]MDE9447981.1 nucleotidyl transferase AbiEii/AbiGii toxin family protein [Xenorhabdus bovienii]
MADTYFTITPDEQQEILGYAAEQLGRSETILEKDIWVCWVLKTLFSLPDAPPMAFKEGTSLSKVFNVISRFSEDIDITLDYQYLADGFDPFATSQSGNQIKKFTDRLKRHIFHYANDVVIPYIRSELNNLPTAALHSIRIDESGEKIWVSYPAATEQPDEYLKSEVLIELGGRNVIEPNEFHVVKPYVSEVVTDLEFPAGQVVVLSPERTFWEKATLIGSVALTKQVLINVDC